ncbi:MAG: protein kinase [Candidatus Latescibacterota bacterium]|nr:MAG: protein kinase [Candidatus Latescibacterota bacterium]
MIGKTVLHYQITEEIGRGGMGIVYKATDTKLKRTVALKFLPPVVSPEDRARFEVEAQSVAHLQHPNICGIHEINEFDGQTFIVMPYLDGTELKNLTAAGPMEIPEAVEVALQVALALQEAHEHEIVHRDIKPANILITRKGLVKVMDFGLAKRRDTTQITKAGTTLGTVDYMSPEQAVGNPVDHRTDIWSLGVMLYEMLTGQMPFSGEFDQAVIYSIINRQPKPLSSVRTEAPEGLHNILERALSKNPDDRYQNIGEMVADLQEIQSEVGVPDRIGSATVAVAGRPSTGSRHRTARPRQTSAVIEEMRYRQVPLVLGLYVIFSALIVLVLKWSVNHFPVSPHLPGFILTSLALLLPVVFILTYFRTGHLASKVGVPVYIVAAAVGMLLAFQNKDLGAATETVRVVDEGGNTIERVLPKGEFRKRLAVFYFDNKTGDPNLDWVSYGIIHMLNYDLKQDTYVSSDMGFTRLHREAGYNKPVGSPLPLKREFASRFHFPRFLAGSFRQENSDFIIDVVLYDTRSGRLLSEHRYRGENIFVLNDTISIQLRRDIGIPNYHIANNPDLPVSEMFTSSLEALEQYVKGANSIYQDNNYEQAVLELEQAVAIDPAFASAHWELYEAYRALNQGDRAQEAIRLALKHKYRLPESEQLSLLDDYYDLREDPEAGFANARRWATLHPEAAGAHVALAQHYERSSDFEAAIAERKILFEIDPQRFSELHAIGRLYENIGNDDEALRYYHEYAELHPDKYDSYTTVGRFHRQRGDYDSARDYYKKALLVDPERVFIRTSLAEIERRTGNFEASFTQCEEALAGAHTARDSSTALWQLMKYYSFRGEAEKALTALGMALEKMRRNISPLGVMVNTVFSLPIYVDAGKIEEAIAISRQFENEPSVSFFKPLVSVGYILTYAATEDSSYLQEVEKHVALFEQWVKTAGMSNYQWAVEYCNVLVSEWRGDFEVAFEHIKAALDQVPPDEYSQRVSMLIRAAEITRSLGNYSEAIGFLDRLFVLEPLSPEGHLEAARIYHAKNQPQQAIDHLKKALQVWENADPTHPRATQARRFAEELEMSS